MKSQLKFKDLEIGQRFSIYWNGNVIFRKIDPVINDIITTKEFAFLKDIFSESNAFNEETKTRVHCGLEWPVWLK